MEQRYPGYGDLDVETRASVLRDFWDDLDDDVRRAEWREIARDREILKSKLVPYNPEVHGDYEFGYLRSNDYVRNMGIWKKRIEEAEAQNLPKRKGESYVYLSCEGCIWNAPGQIHHMGIGGCLEQKKKNERAGEVS